MHGPGEELWQAGHPTDYRDDFGFDEGPRATPATPDGFKPTAHVQALPFEARAFPALADGRLYARSKDRLWCLDLAKP